jgi:hypothetical protein
MCALKVSLDENNMKVMHGRHNTNLIVYGVIILRDVLVFLYVCSFGCPRINYGYEYCGLSLE